MPLQKTLFKSGVNRENTRYTIECGWYECDKIRFRQGSPEKLGGWRPFSLNRFLGTCRSLWNWITLGNLNLIGIGTHLKFYISRGGAFFDVTPIRGTASLVDPFTAVAGSTTLTVADVAHGCITGDYVTFSGAVGLGGNVSATVLNKEYAVTVIDDDSYSITMAVTANATDATNSPGGGGAVSAAYQVSVGPEIQIPLNGWGAGPWGYGPWGIGTTTNESLRIWNQTNFGEDLLYGPRGGGIYYWDATTTVNARGVDLTTLGDADTPLFQNGIIVSDAARTVLVFGTNDYGFTEIDPMLIRWSAQEDPFTWTPAITNQAGSVRLSHGSQIVAQVQTRQEIVVFTDQAVYSLQYAGPPIVWSAQLLGDNISIISPNSAIMASGVVYWMGVDKFYIYDGRVQTLDCDLRRFVFEDLNKSQSMQIFCGTNEGFNEVWWFYPSAGSTVVDRYVIFNYAEHVWYYGTIGRTAWLDSGTLPTPIAASYARTIVSHEVGVDDNTTGVPTAMEAYISSAEFDIGDGHNLGFVWRILPDLTFSGSTSNTAQATMTLYPLQNSGSGAGTPKSGTILRGTSYDITEEFTGQIFTRVRGRQMIFKMASTQLGTNWQLGAPRIDIRPDGRR